MRLTATLALAAAFFATPTLAKRASPETELASALKGRVAGAAVSCIQLSRVTNAQVIDRTAILYRAGPILYVNRPRAGASSLHAMDVLVTRTFAGQLCKGDPVERHDSSTGFPRGPVLLGDFVPYRRPR